MGLKTTIGWCDATWNPWRGCVPVSAGCANCYAARESLRNPEVLGTWGGEGKGQRVVAAEGGWADPVVLNRRAAAAPTHEHRPRLFVGSMMDIFEKWGGPVHDHKGRVMTVLPDGRWAPADADAKITRLLTLDDIRDRVFTLVARTPEIDWLFLTKRTAEVLPTLRRIGAAGRDEGVRGPRTSTTGADLAGLWADGGFPPNVWLGASVETQQQLWLRAEHLRDIPARLRFLSAEPLLGPLDFGPWFGRKDLLVSDPFDWVIVGGESGYDARGCDVGWVRGVVDQCKAHAIPVFVKQLGGNPYEAAGQARAAVKVPLELLHPKGEDIGEFPADLRLQEFPDLEVGDDVPSRRPG